MKLKKFIGKGIRGYMNHEINFRESVTFLVGINGSGKTSVLKLINALTAPSYNLLESIEYSYIELSLVHDTKEYIISSTKDKDNIRISLNHVGFNTTSDVVNRIDTDFSDLSSIDEDTLMIYSERFNNLPTCQEIRKLSTPIFIGIERMPGNDILRMLQRTRRVSRLNHSVMSSVDRSLASIQEQIYDLYRRIAVRQKNLSDEFRDNIVRESISLMISKNDFYTSVNLHPDIAKYEERRSKFKDALLHAGIDDAEEITNDFFDNQKKYLEIITQSPKDDVKARTEAFLGLSLSNVQMDGIDKIILHEAKYKETLDKMNEPFTRFVECANLFFKESGKEIKVQDNGLIKVYNQYLTEDGRMRLHSSDINALSSGEKQIVALIGSLIFSVSNVRPEVMIIDEPELSLHLTWQEIFVDSILKAQPQFQFILATHSPTIISKIERRDWCEDLSRKMV